MAGGHPEPDPGGTKRPAPLQQLRPFDAHRNASRGEHPGGIRARYLGGQCRERVPRGGRRGRASVRRRARYPDHGEAARMMRLPPLVAVALTVMVLLTPPALAQNSAN